MSFFALFFFLPVLAYGLVQTVRDIRSKSVIMAIWGGLLSAFLILLVAQVFLHPKY